MTATDTICDAVRFREVIGHFTSGVAIVTTQDAHGEHGMTASAVSSLSLEPPMLVVCLHLRAPTQEAIRRSRRFGLSILEERQADIARRFATPALDKFEGVAFDHGTLGQPLVDGALARLECEVVRSIVGGTHRVFLGAVMHAQIGLGAPLAYYRGRFGRLAVSGP